MVEIAAERIAVCPDTRLCSDCAKSVEEKYGGEFVVTAPQTSLGKTQSLKKNYGDVTTQKTRRELRSD
jgi:RNA polymerase-binding transcription factor DksA